MGQNACGSQKMAQEDGARLPGDAQIVVRRLGDRDRTQVAAFLNAEPGYSLFLAGNLPLLSEHNSFVRYWGAFEDKKRLQAVLMMVGGRAALYAPSGVDVGQLARVAVVEEADFTMGRPDLVDALLAFLPPDAVEFREEHYLAELAPEDLPETYTLLPGGLVVRRATLHDLDALTAFYEGTDGFEELTTDQLRHTMTTRIRTLRTYIATVNGALVSAASTSSETSAAAMIGGVWTAPDARNRGYSTAVVTALAHALLLERRRPYLFYLADNAPAAHVYASVGFRVIGRWSVVYLRAGATNG